MMSVCTGRQLLLLINSNYCSKNMFKRYVLASAITNCLPKQLKPCCVYLIQYTYYVTHSNTTFKRLTLQRINHMREPRNKEALKGQACYFFSSIFNQKRLVPKHESDTYTKFENILRSRYKGIKGFRQANMCQKLLARK